MAFRNLPEQARLLQLFSYNPVTGDVVRITRVTGRPSTKDAVGSDHIRGYLTVCVDAVSYLLHRIIWKMVTGVDPNFIDHDDGIRTNNRWNNLNSVTMSGNAKNSGKPRTNTSGVVGVIWRADRGKWVAQISSRVDGRHVKKYLGIFAEFDAAVAVRRAAERDRGFHPNHGRDKPIAYPCNSDFSVKDQESPS